MATGKETDVIIKGLGRDLPKWATERTLAEMNANVKTIVAAIAGSSKVKNLNVKKTQEEVDSFDKALKKLREEQINKTSFSFAGASKGIASFTTGLATSLASVKVFTMLIDYLKDTSQMLLGLYDTGITFQNGLGDFTAAAGRAAMPLDDFARLITRNSAVLKSFGADGEKTFATILNSTRNLVKQQGTYGLNISQLNEYTGQYLEMMRLQGSLERMSNQDRARSAANYLKELTAYSQIMGKSREQINKEIQDQSRKPLVQAALNAMTPVAKEVLLSTIGAISGTFKDAATAETFQNALQEAALTPYGALTDFSKALGTFAPELNRKFLDYADALGKGTLTEEESTKRRIEILQGLQGLSQTQREQIKNMTSIDSTLREGSLQLTSIFSELQGIDLSKVNSALVKQPDKFSQAVVNLSNMFNDIRGKISEVFGNFILQNQDKFDAIIKNISNFAEFAAQQMQKALQWLANFIDPATRTQAIKDIKDGISDVLNGVLDAILEAIRDKILGTSAEEREAKNNIKAIAIRNSETGGEKLSDRQQKFISEAFSKGSENGWEEGDVKNFLYAARQARIKNVESLIGSLAQNDARIGQAYNNMLGKPIIPVSGQNVATIESISPVTSSIGGNSGTAMNNNNMSELIEINKQMADSLSSITALTEENKDINNSIKRTTKFNSNIGL